MLLHKLSSHSTCIIVFSCLLSNISEQEQTLDFNSFVQNQEQYTRLLFKFITTFTLDTKPLQPNSLHGCSNADNRHSGAQCSCNNNSKTHTQKPILNLQTFHMNKK